MIISIFDLFKIGIGPSSSHTVGPMIAAYQFINLLINEKKIHSLSRLKIDLYGSLALTGVGHGTDKAMLLGLEGQHPETIDPDTIDHSIERIKDTGKIRINAHLELNFSREKDINFHRKKSLAHHPNGLIISAYLKDKLISSQTFYSIGGGFVVTEEDMIQKNFSHGLKTQLPYPFQSAADLLKLAKDHKKSIASLVFSNECHLRPKKQVLAKLNSIWSAMNDCIDRGCQQTGQLPGSLKVKRRAHDIYKELTKNPEQTLNDPLTVMDWVNLYAIAVNEENASGSKIVTAPTNGSAGVIPAIIRYYQRFCPHSSTQGIHDILLTAAAIGCLYANNASLSGAEVGCQGEVGVACSMAAGGLTAALGGSPLQVEQAAEIAMEHNLGLTCDPIGGLVQIPCIERNAMGAIKAINAARIALKGDGQHFVSLDSVIKTMKDTGKDMNKKYKETSRGGLAVNVTVC